MASLQKYKMMLKIGLAEGAVRNKMKQEGFDDAKIDELFSSGQVVVPAPAPASAAAAPPSGGGASATHAASSRPGQLRISVDPSIEKIAAADLIIARHQFVLGMLKVALPKDAIFEDIAGGGAAGDSGGAAAASAPPPPAAGPPLSAAAQRPQFAKYRMMSKIGLAEGAIRQKMLSDGFSEADVGGFFG